MNPCTSTQRKIRYYRDKFAENPNIFLLPAITNTYPRAYMTGFFVSSCCWLAARLKAHFTAIGMLAQQQCDSFHSRAAFYDGLKSQVGLLASTAAALKINLNVDGCAICRNEVCVDYCWT